MIGPLVYLVTSCDYTISNNNLALDMESAIIPFCGRIKNVRPVASAYMMSFTIYQFCKKFCWHIYGSPRSERFFLNHIAWGEIDILKFKIFAQLYTFAIVLRFPLSQKLYGAAGHDVLYFNINIKKLNAFWDCRIPSLKEYLLFSKYFLPLWPSIWFNTILTSDGTLQNCSLYHRVCLSREQHLL